MELAALCPDCARTADAIRLSGGLMTVEVQENRLLVRRGSAAVEVFPREVRHTSAPLSAGLVDALVEAAARLALVGCTQRILHPADLRPQKFLPRSTQHLEQSGGLAQSFSMNSSGVTPACFRMPRSVPMASSRCSGTTHPKAPSGVSFLSTT
jgi:hypothetical protein